jgi:hypothetical protein
LINGPYGIYARDASHNYYELITTHDNYETGFQLQGASSNNTVIYLDSYRNRDPRKNGESADGFACKEGSGEGNVLRNARLWDNVDDGLDLFMFGSAVTLEEVYAWGNGFNRWNFKDFNGDGNGFKLGITDNPPANHILKNNIAFSNAKKGFIDNGNPGKLTVERNTAWDNGDVGFNFRSSTSSLKNNIAAGNVGSSQVTLVSSVTASGNSWVPVARMVRSRPVVSLFRLARTSVQPRAHRSRLSPRQDAVEASRQTKGHSAGVLARFKTNFVIRTHVYKSPVFFGLVLLQANVRPCIQSL